MPNHPGTGFGERTHPPSLAGGAVADPVPLDYSSPDLSDTVVQTFFGGGFEIAKNANPYPNSVASSTFDV